MTHIPNADTYRPWLGEEYNLALFQLTQDANDISLNSNLHPHDIIKRWIKRAWDKQYPNSPLPKTKRYDLDFVHFG